MNPVDLIVLVLVVSFAIAGLRQGFLVSIVSFLGFAGGGLLGLLLIPHLLGSQTPGKTRAVVALGGVLVIATVVQTLAAWVASRLRRHLVWQPARRVDAAGGGIVGIVAVLVVTWLLGSVLLRADSSVPFASDARDSSVLAVVDKVMPGSPDQVFSAFGKLLDTTGFPQVFTDLTQERPAPVAAPDGTVSKYAGVRLAARSTVKIIGNADSCGRRIEGSGFVFAPQRVMTNAHVLAGVTDPKVYLDGTGRGYPARVVAFDPQTDLAVLWVPSLDLPPLTFGGAAAQGTDSAAIGYPGDGPLVVSPARIRGTTLAVGQDIYGSGRVVRSIYALRAVVRPGNSGGPVVGIDGRVLGVVFAASRDDPETGYALTATQVARVAAEGRSAVDDVATGRCD
jgi:S1-C subfamily serine protease